MTTNPEEQISAQGDEMNSEEQTTEATPLRSKRKNRTTTRFFAAGGVLALAVAFLIYNGMQGTGAFYMTVDELQSSSEVTAGKQVKVGGDVVAGSIQRGSIGEEIHFEITDGVSQIPIVYNGAAPDIFADHAEVIATGTMDADGTFHATELLTKCPSRFEAMESTS